MVKAASYGGGVGSSFEVDAAGFSTFWKWILGSGLPLFLIEDTVAADRMMGRRSGEVLKIRVLHLAQWQHFLRQAESLKFGLGSLQWFNLFFSFFFFFLLTFHVVEL